MAGSVESSVEPSGKAGSGRSHHHTPEGGKNTNAYAVASLPIHHPLLSSTNTASLETHHRLFALSNHTRCCLSLPALLVSTRLLCSWKG
jgi:hypothetical protein